MHAGQRGLGNHVPHHLDRVVLHDPQIADPLLGDLLAQAADSGVCTSMAR